MAKSKYCDCKDVHIYCPKGIETAKCAYCNRPLKDEPSSAELIDKLVNSYKGYQKSQEEILEVIAERLKNIINYLEEK